MRRFERSDINSAVTALFLPVDSSVHLSQNEAEEIILVRFSLHVENIKTNSPSLNSQIHNHGPQLRN